MASQYPAGDEAPSAVVARAELTVVVLVACCSGCGGPITPDELSRSIDTLASTAAEGELLAADVADDRTKATFARVHARDLGDVVQPRGREAERRDADRGDVAAAKTKAVELADRIDTALGQIQVAPRRRAGARSAGHELDACRAGERARGGPVKGSSRSRSG